MNISRMCMDGTTRPEEQLNKSQLYIKIVFLVNFLVYLIKRGDDFYIFYL